MNSDDLKAAALATGGHDWQWWDSCSFRRLTFKEGRHTRDGSALSAVVQQSDGHPDVRMAPGVREFIELTSPANVLALLEERGRLREALAGLIACDDLKRRIAIESATMIPETDEDLAELDRLMSDLANRLPKAWETARAALSQEQER